MITELDKLKETCKHLTQEKAIMQQQIANLDEAMRDVIARFEKHVQNLDAHKE